MKKIILSLSILFVLYSCNTDNLPNDALISDTAYKSVDDLQKGLIGVYSNYTNRNIVTFNSIFTDECKVGADNGGQQLLLYNQLLDASEANSSAIWTAHYRVINRANRILFAATKITPTAAQLSQYNNIKGQCYALRALCHLDLMNHYTVDPTILTSAAVPYIDFVVGNEKLPRNSVAQVRDGILQDLATASTFIVATDKTFATKGFLDFVKAKTYFLTGDYPAALTIANDLMSTIPLANTTQYVNMFKDTDNTEVIFKRRRVALETFMGGTWYFTGTGGAFMEMSNKMFAAINNSTSDVRRNVLFDNINSNPANNKHLINKYPGSSGIPFLNDEKVMRISEVYLIKIECQARLTQFTDAAVTMKALRDARFGSSTTLDTYSNMTDAATAILSERNIELGYEGHRYVDVKRLRNIVNVGIERNPLDCGGAVPCTLGITDHRFTLPIPQAEIGTNTVIASQQNPNY